MCSSPSIPLTTLALCYLTSRTSKIVPLTHARHNCFIFIRLAGLSPLETEISRQSYAGLLWSKQFYHYIIQDWLIGDPEMPAPPTDRFKGRNSEAEWQQLFNRDIVSMPDKWEYPWVSWANLWCILPLSIHSSYTNVFSWKIGSLIRYYETLRIFVNLRCC